MGFLILLAVAGMIAGGNPQVERMMDASVENATQIFSELDGEPTNYTRIQEENNLSDAEVRLIKAAEGRQEYSEKMKDAIREMGDALAAMTALIYSEGKKLGAKSPVHLSLSLVVGVWLFWMLAAGVRKTVMPLAVGAVFLREWWRKRGER